jgi:hypothetical protein
MQPRVFISSTFYDLRHVRDELRHFLDELGYEPLLSELSTFPIDPDQSTVENCKRRVENDADILVLVIGARYGSLAPGTSRSVTNVEYLTARVKSIPIYAFLEKSVEPLYGLWKENRSIDLTPRIDNPELMKFVDEVRSTDSVWTFPFETASDIVTVLRAQFAHLMFQGLEWGRKVRVGPLTHRVASLSGRSLRLALDRPRQWGPALLFQVVEDEIAKARHLRDEHFDNLALELGEDVLSAGLWTTNRMSELTRLQESIVDLFTTGLKRALTSGVSPDPDDVIFVGQALGRIYEALLKWSRRIRTANVRIQFDTVRTILAKFVDGVIRDFEQYGPRGRAALDDILKAEREGLPRPPLPFDLNVKLPPDLVTALSTELERMKEGVKP